MSPLVWIKANLENRTQLSVKAKWVCSVNPRIRQTNPPCHRQLRVRAGHPLPRSQHKSKAYVQTNIVPQKYNTNRKSNFKFIGSHIFKKLKETGESTCNNILYLTLSPQHMSILTYCQYKKLLPRHCTSLFFPTMSSSSKVYFTAMAHLNSDEPHLKC